ncbi:hypothetical protein CsatB_007825 [Cannabis sativa]
MSFLVSMATCSKRKITAPKETKPSIREVVHGILAASSAPRNKKSWKGSKAAEAAPPIHECCKGKSKVAKADEGSSTFPIEISQDEVDNGTPCWVLCSK